MDFIKKVKHNLVSDSLLASRPYDELGEGGDKPRSDKPRPMSILESVTFSYINPVLDLGFKRPLELTDLPAPSTQDSAQTVLFRPLFSAYIFFSAWRFHFPQWFMCTYFPLTPWLTFLPHTLDRFMQA